MSSDAPNPAASGSQTEPAQAAAASGETDSAVASPDPDASAERLADELRPYVPQTALPTQGAEELQLAICRKLREVRERDHGY